MFFNKKKLSAQSYILHKYKVALKNPSNKSTNNNEKAQILFEVFLKFISKFWRYFPEGNILSIEEILLKEYSESQNLNCFDLSAVFVELCKKIGIEEAHQYIIKNKPGKSLGEKFSENYPSLVPFDNNFTIFNDNQFLFDVHCVAKVDNRYFDPVFSTYSDDIDAPFDNSPYGQLLSCIASENEAGAIELLGDDNTIDIDQTFEGLALLHRAAYAGLYKVAARLIDLGADMQRLSNEKLPKLPLYYALLSQPNNIELFTLLSRDIEASIVMEIKEELEVLTEKEINMENLLISAIDMVASGDIVGLKRAFELGLNIDTQDDFGFTLLHYAVSHQQTKIIDWLIDNNANVNLSNNEGYVPLELYYDVELPTFRRLLTQTNTMVLCKILTNKNSQSIVLFALNLIAKGNLVDLNQLVKKGLDVNSQSTFDGTSLLHQAAIYGKTDIFGFLIENNAKADIADQQGKFPLNYLYNVIIVEFDQYLDQRTNEHDITLFGKKYLTLFGPWFGHDKETKINAATKLISLLEGNEIVSFTKEEQEALKNARLGQLVAKYMPYIPSQVWDGGSRTQKDSNEFGLSL